VTREIDLLIEAAVGGRAVVDKASHVLWTHEELVKAGLAGCYPDEDRVAPPTGVEAASGPYPGCVQQHAAPTDLTWYRLLGQTEHFLIFAPPGAGLPRPA
jgi:hypothetical protein